MNICIVSPKAEQLESFIRMQVEYLPARVDHLYGNWYPAEYEEKPLHRFIRHNFMTRLRSLIGSRLPAERQAFRAFLSSRRTDVVLAQYGPTGVAVMDDCREMKIPLLVYFLGFDASDSSFMDGYRLKYQELFNAADAILCQSGDLRDRLIAMGAASDKTIVNTLGADTAKFSDCLPSFQNRVFLAVGRFVEKKAPHITIRAFHETLKRITDAKLIMAGDGPILEACKALVMELDISHAVSFPGRVAHEALPDLMKTASVFVQHSLVPASGDSEGVPVILLEAGAAGLPVVSTRHGGIPEIVVHGETGLLGAEGDVPAMAEYMISLAADLQLAKSMGERARRHVFDNFTIQQSIDRLWSVINNVLNR